MFSSKDKLFMERAFELAVESFDDQEVPVGAVIVKDGKIIGEGKNKVISKNDVTSGVFGVERTDRCQILEKSESLL